MKYARQVVGYHGCDAAVAARLVVGESFVPSRNPWDWLGPGIYFWEHGPDRAWRFAEDQKQRGKVARPVVVGAVLQLGRCFDLLDTRFTALLAQAYPAWRRRALKVGPLPKNAGRTPDLELRRLDCAVLTWYLDLLDGVGDRYDSVRGGFTEGRPVFPGSGIRREHHIQIAVRNPGCILGVFLPGGSGAESR